MDKKIMLKRAIKSLLTANVEIMNYHLCITNDDKAKKICRKVINRGKKAMEIIDGINHIEILESLYRSFIYGKEQYFAIVSATIVEKARKWDTEKGFKEFLELDNQAQEQAKKELEERQQDQETIKAAKEMGKKIEMVMQNGRLRPVVIEEPLN